MKSSVVESSILRYWLYEGSNRKPLKSSKEISVSSSGLLPPFLIVTLSLGLILIASLCALFLSSFEVSWSFRFLAEICKSK